MALTLTAPPAGEPVTLAEAKAHLRVDTSSDDALIGSLIVTSRLQIEAALGLALLTQSWRQTLSVWPDSGLVDLKVRPVQSISSVYVATAPGMTATLDPSVYTLTDDGNKPQLAPAALLEVVYAWPVPQVRTNGITIDFVASYGSTPDSVPAPLRHALLLLTAHWYENRSSTDPGSETARIPGAVSALFAPYRRARL